jgi:hypothetical protein
MIRGRKRRIDVAIVQREFRNYQFGRRVEVAERATECAAISRLSMPDEKKRFADDRAVAPNDRTQLEVPLTAHCPDAKDVAHDFNI